MEHLRLKPTAGGKTPTEDYLNMHIDCLFAKTQEERDEIINAYLLKHPEDGIPST